MSSFPAANELTRTPAKSADGSLLLTTPPRSKASTRSDTAKARYRYVDSEGDRPNDTDWENFIVILDASITKMDGPVFGIVGSPASVFSKAKKKSSQRQGVHVRELYHDAEGVEEFVADRNLLEFVTKERHVMQLDHLKYRTGRILSDNDTVEYVQVCELQSDLNDIPRELIDENMFAIDPASFHKCSQIEYMLNYGCGEHKSRMAKVNKSGCLLEDRICNLTGLKRQRKPSQSFFTIDCDMGDELPYLNEEGELEMTTPEEYLINEVYDTPAVEEKPKQLPRPTVKQATRMTTGSGTTAVKVEPKIKVKVPKTKKKISFAETDKDSESDKEIEDDPVETDTDDIDGFVLSQPVERIKTSSNKYGLVVSELGFTRHNALFNDGLFNGKWKGMSVEGRAERLHRMETKRGKYENTKTAFLTWFTGNFGTDPLAYLLPYAKVPTSEKQCIPNEKWTTSVAPSKWIRSMRDLSQCINQLTEIARLYFRQDVYIAIEAINQKSHDWYDMDLAMAGVNAYRDLFQGALAAIVDGAVDGLTNEDLLQVGLMEIHPSSKAYAEIICDRLQRVTAGAQWGTQQRGGGGRGGGGTTGGGTGNGVGSGGRGGGPKTTASRSTEEKPSKPPLTMSDEQKLLVPMVGDRKVCLANMSSRGCLSKGECPFLHEETAEVPNGLKNYFKKRFGNARSL